MNLSQLQFFVTLSETMSFSQAAKRCFVSQPTLSNGISHLEEELGGKLFDRNTRCVVVTDFGEQMLPFAESVLQAKNALVRAAQDRQRHGPEQIRVAQTPLVDAASIMRLLQSVCDQDGVEISFSECYIEDLDREIVTGIVDLGVRPVCEELPLSSQLRVLLNYEEPLWCLFGRKNTASSGVRLADLDNRTFILTPGNCGLAGVTRELFRHHRLNLVEYSGAALSYPVMQDWAWLGLGCAILPESKLDPRYREFAGPLLGPDGAPLMIAYEVIVKRERQSSYAAPALQSLLNGHTADTNAA